jgi:hypothetical protein
MIKCVHVFGWPTNCFLLRSRPPVPHSNESQIKSTENAKINSQPVVLAVFDSDDAIALVRVARRGACAAQLEYGKVLFVLVPVTCILPNHKKLQ